MTKPVRILISDYTLLAVLDIAIHSMDFGSGFLDCEEVQHLQEVALLLRVPFENVTPHNHQPDGYYRATCPCSKLVAKERARKLLEEAEEELNND